MNHINPHGLHDLALAAPSLTQFLKLFWEHLENNYF